MTRAIRLPLVALLLLCVAWASGCGSSDEFSGDGAKVKKGERGLKYIVLKEGAGEPAKAGDTVQVHYTGWLRFGSKFDSSRDRGELFEFLLGAQKVIMGWDLGVAGMKEGEQRKLFIPPEIGYGGRGSGEKIPPNATLIFDVELLKIVR